jgi:hypothetical protein
MSLIMLRIKLQPREIRIRNVNRIRTKSLDRMLDVRLIRYRTSISRTTKHKLNRSNLNL